MSICLLTVGDGRDEVHERSWESVQEALPFFDDRVLVDDRDHELGFAGAIQRGWEQVVETKCDYCFHAELDFIFKVPVPLDRMVAVLEEHPYLAQLVLKRQPVNAEEIQAGGIVEQWPESYRQRTDKGDVWTEHRLFWSTNPSLYPAAWCRHGWPQVEASEMAWTERLLEDPELRFAFWGAKFDAPLVEHVGERVGAGY